MLAQIYVLLILIVLKCVFCEQIFHARIEEELPIGSNVISLLPKGDLPKLGRLILLQSPESDENFFRFQQGTSNLTINKRIDFEHFKRISFRSGVVTLQINVGLSDGSKYALIEIEVMDINDNAPQFPKHHFDVIFPEDAKIGQTYQIERAIDFDSPVHGVDSYEIVSGNDAGLFSLDEDMHGNLVIKLIGTLDRELVAVHRLQIAARDKGTPVLSGYAIVFVTVTDVNDNAPICIDLFVNMTAQQGGNHITMPQAKIETKDADEGSNGRISKYTLSNLPGKSKSNIIKVDDKTGIVRTSGFACPDPCIFPDGSFLPRSKYSCCFYDVTINDDGQPPLEGKCHLTAVVEYENEHEPVINIRPAQLVANSGKGEQQLGVVVVTDADLGIGGVVGATLLPGSYDSHFKLVEKSSRPGFAIYALKQIDEISNTIGNLFF